MNSEQLSDKIANLIFEKKGSDVKVIEIKAISGLTDYFVLCSADSDVQVKAIADHVEHTLRDEAVRVWHKEGYTSLNWVLLDYVDVVVHVFKTEAREFYNLERLWAGAPTKELTDPIQ